MNGSDENQESRRSRFGRFAAEHKIFSGIVGTLLALAVTVYIATNDSDRSDSQSTVRVETQPPEPRPEAEPGEEGGRPDDQERRVTGLITRAEEREDESFSTESTYVEQVAVDGIIDPVGVHMYLDDLNHSAAITVAVNREFRWLRGQVGITSEPCSPGPVAHVGVRDPDGRLLWPESGQLKEVRREALRFKVEISAEDSVVLYAEAPEAEAGYCGAFSDNTSVGWVNAELIAE